MSAKKKYLNLENIDNSCWLDAAIILIANNKTFKKTVEDHPDSHIKEIITNYNDALANLNDSSDARKALKQSKLILRTLQRDTLNYLKEFLKFKIGEPESAFCALLNLIYHDNSPIKEHLNTTWIWHKQCLNCNESTKSVVTKPIVTLAKVKTFNPAIPTSWYTCTCKKKVEMKVEFVEISDCLIFHFENGAGNGKTIPLQFFIKQREYYLTSLMMYEESEGSDKDHFVTWIRQPFTEKWLECNDLNNKLVYFSKVKPQLKMKNIYVVVYETFDNLAKTKFETFSNEDDMASNIKKIELIDLSADKKSLLNCSSNVEMRMNSLPSNEKSLTQKALVKQNIENIFSSSETKTSKGKVKSMVKPSKESLSHYENKTSKDKKTSIVKPTESLPSSNANETSKKTGMVKPKIKTDGKDLTDSHAVNYNAAENSDQTRKVNKKSAGKIGYDKEKLSEYIGTVVGRTMYAFFDYLSTKKIEKPEDTLDEELFEASPEIINEAEFGPAFFSDILSAVTGSIAEFSLSDARSAPSNVMDSDKKE